ncbi:MAG: molybdopterin-dependent oxidoreductase [Proteobacteria bacterium]|nr:molybdopterin-dependent oxidoreductase [Pseudomonadota bacterium]
MAEPIREIQTFCALCRSRCGCRARVAGDRLLEIVADPTHPTGQALCAKGRASPELVSHPDRLTTPLKRTRPKTAADPGWQPIGWDQALDEIAAELTRIAREAGPEAVAFAVTSPSATAISDAGPWIERLIHAFGTPNNCNGTEICNWHKDHAHRFTTGAPIGVPDFANTGCIVLWGHNPSTSWLASAATAADARARGAKLIVVDPRKVGLAVKADRFLRVRPGSDGALALGIAGAMLAHGWYDRAFVRDWTNGPLLVDDASGKFVTAAALGLTDDDRLLAAWDARGARPVAYDPRSGAYLDAQAEPALDGVERLGAIACRTAFARYAALAAAWPPARVEQVTGVAAADVVETARLLFAHRPVSYHAWSGVGQHTNATQTDRAIALAMALTGSFDAPGGNLQPATVPVNDVANQDAAGADLIAPARAAKALGLTARPLGPARAGMIASDDLYRAVLERQPYAVRGLVGFGANLALSHADATRARAALQALEFHVQTDLFMTPTAAFADIVLPVASAWERQGLRVGFDVSQAGHELVQLRPALVAPRGEARGDVEIVFALAERLGLGAQFWHGDIEAAYRHYLAPSGVTLEALRDRPAGVRVALTPRPQKYRTDGFATPTRKLELYSERLLDHGQAPLPVYVEPAVGPVSRPDLAQRFPLVLTSTKAPQFCHSQHRNLPSLRRLVRDPTVELHPEAAAARRIADGDWVELATPQGCIRVRARLQSSLDEGVVVAQHGWWQGCADLGLPGYDAFSEHGANYNLVIGNQHSDPISGSVPHRSYLCEIRRLDA